MTKINEKVAHILVSEKKIVLIGMVVLFGGLD